jgi:dipeptidyl aminopeptidase/acylaminoacyl peptidase
MPMIGGPLQKIRDDAAAAVVSWDDSKIAFTNSQRSDISVRDLGTGSDRRVYTSPDSFSIPALAWGPDNQHIAYVRRDRNGSRVSSAHIIDLRTLKVRNVIEAPGLATLWWTRDGRLIYAADEPTPNENSQNLWQLLVSDAGEPRAKPHRLTALFGFQFSFVRGSSDGRKISYVRWRHQSDVMTAEITAAGITLPRRLTQDERIDWPGGWTHDSRAVLFYSDRNGSLDLFKQETDSPSATPLLVDASEKRYPQLSPDGQWILYIAWQEQPAQPSVNGKGTLMRVSVAGGVPQRVMSLRGYPGSARVVTDAYAGLTTTGHPRFRCPDNPGSACIISELSGRQIVFTAFDPAGSPSIQRTSVFGICRRMARAWSWDSAMRMRRHSKSGNSIAAEFSDASPSECAIGISSSTRRGPLTRRRCTSPLSGRPVFRCSTQRWTERPPCCTKDSQSTTSTRRQTESPSRLAK